MIGGASAMERPGSSEAWLSHVLWEHEIVGSNPTSPTIPSPDHGGRQRDQRERSDQGP
jgi:hypothetical protein